MATRTAPHASLVRAAAVEEQRVERALAQLGHRRETLAAEIAALEAQMDELRERRRLLGILVERPGAETGSDEGPHTGVTPVRGRRLRVVAGQLLWRSVGAEEIHYREWFERLVQAGYGVGGRDPIASFLTNIRDSPAVVRAGRPGFYRLDPARAEEAAREAEEARAELADVEAALRAARDGADLARVERLRSDRDDVVVRLRRLDARCDELTAVFGTSAPPER